MATLGYTRSLKPLMPRVSPSGFFDAIIIYYKLIAETMYPNGKLVSSEIEIRGGKSYEQKTYRDDKGAESVIERLVTKSSYDASIARLEQQLATLNSLRDDALE